MKLRYFVVDGNGQLQKVSQAGVKGLWEGHRQADSLACRTANELRLVSVVCDDTLLPTKLYVLRLPLTEGRLSLADRLILELFTMPGYPTPAKMVEHHSAGWPADFFCQLAVALDVPLAFLQVPVGVGGPLFTAAAMKVSPQPAISQLR